MKKGPAAIICVIVAILLILIFYPDSTTEIKPTKNNSIKSETELGLIEKWGNNCNTQIESANRENPEEIFVYPGARAFNYGGDPQCDHVYQQAFEYNNKEICNYLENEKARAVCIGSASKDPNDLSICDELTNSAKDICLVNILIKDYKKTNLPSKDSSEKICNKINRQPLKALCFSILAKSFNDVTYCNFEGDSQIICIEKYLLSKQNEQTSLSSEGYEAFKEALIKESISLCDASFESKGEKAKCYYLLGFNFGFNLYGNKTTYGAIKTENGELTFTNYSKFAGWDLIILQITKEVQDSYGTYSNENKYFRCEAIFEDYSKIKTECEDLNNGDYCIIEPWGGCNYISYWTYDPYTI